MSEPQGRPSKRQKTEEDTPNIWLLRHSHANLETLTPDQFVHGFRSYTAEYIGRLSAYALMIVFQDKYRWLQLRYLRFRNPIIDSTWLAEEQETNENEDKPTFNAPKKQQCIVAINSFTHYMNEAERIGNQELYLTCCSYLADWFAVTLSRQHHKIEESVPDIMQRFAGVLDILEKREQLQATKSQSSKSALEQFEKSALAPSDADTPAQASSSMTSTRPPLEQALPAAESALSTGGVNISTQPSTSSEKAPADMEQELNQRIDGWQCSLEDGSVLPWESFSDTGNVKTDIEMYVGMSTLWKGPPMAIEGGTGTILYGPGGTGKTSFVQSLAHKFTLPLFAVGPDHLRDKLHGNSEKLVTCLFQRLRSRAPCVLFFDEVDTLFATPADGDNLSHTIIGCIKRCWGDIMKEGCKILVYGATNQPWRLAGDSAIARRFQNKVYLGLPERQNILDMLTTFFAEKLHTLQSSDLEWLAIKLQGGSHSDIMRFLKKVLLQQGWNAFQAGNWTEGVHKGKKYLFPAPVSGLRRSYEDEPAEVQRAISYSPIDRAVMEAALNKNLFIKTVNPAEVERLIQWGRKNTVS